MTIHSNGTLYFTGPVGVRLVRPTGNCLGEIPVPESRSNVTFGGPDGKIQFLTCKGKHYSLAIRTKVAAHGNGR